MGQHAWLSGCRTAEGAVELQTHQRAAAAQVFWANLRTTSDVVIVRSVPASFSGVHIFLAAEFWALVFVQKNQTQIGTETLENLYKLNHLG